MHVSHNQRGAFSGLATLPSGVPRVVPSILGQGEEAPGSWTTSPQVFQGSGHRE